MSRLFRASGLKNNLASAAPIGKTLTRDEQIQSKREPIGANPLPLIQQTTSGDKGVNHANKK